MEKLSDLRAPERDATTEKPLLSFFDSKQWVIYALLILVGLFLRWYQLDLRPVHHDESQHGMFGKYFFDFPDVNHYKYNPMLHGPLLYNLYRLVYNVLGSNNWSFRVPMCLLGSLYILLPLLFRRYLSRSAVLFATLGLALGPTAIYWSRFAREDFYTMFGLVCMLYGVALASARGKSFWVLFGLTVQLCSKENSFVHMGFFLGLLVYELYWRWASVLIRERRFSEIATHTTIAAIALGIFGLSVYKAATSLGICLPTSLVSSLGVEIVVLQIVGAIFALGVLCYEIFWVMMKEGSNSIVARALNNLKTYRYEFALSFAACSIFYSYLYSAGFRHIPGILDGLGRTSICYWVQHHSMERIKGPFLHQFYVLSWYESLFVLAYFAYLIHFYITSGRVMRYVGLGLAVLAAIAVIPSWFFDVNVEQAPLWKLFKLKDTRDVLGLVILLIHPVICTTYHFFRGEWRLGVWAYTFTGLLFTYCYLGEKVPWLSMYPLFAGLIFLPLYFDARLHERPLRSWDKLPWFGLLYTTGAVLIILGLIFILEEALGSGNQTWAFLAKDNAQFLVGGVLIVLLGYSVKALKLWGTYNLATLSFVVIAFYNIRASIQTNFIYAGQASEYISQVHTSPEFHQIANKIREESLASTKGYKVYVLGRGESTWPLTWYMVGTEGYNFDLRDGKKLEDYDYIFDSWENDKQLETIPAGYKGRRLDFRGWWVPDFNQITLKKFLRYALNHQPWSGTGYTYLLFMSKQK